MKHTVLLITITLGTLLFVATACAAPAAVPSAPTAAVAPSRAPSETAPPSPLPTHAPTAVTSVCSPAVTPQPTLPAPAVALPTPILISEEAPITAPSQLLDTHMTSPLLGQEEPILVYLPPGYSTDQGRYPVLYMLSGFAGDAHEWVNWGMCDVLEGLIRYQRIQPLIVVMPEGDHSWWFNHPKVAGSDGKPWGDYIWKDVVNYVDSTYRTLRQRESRAIGGLSAGGQSAFMLALTHPEVFSIAGAHSPSVRGADGSLAIFGTPDYFNQYDPRWLFQNTDTWKQLSLWMDVGSGDTEWGDADLQLHNMLVSLGIPHEWQNTWPGIHDDYYWGAHIADYLEWYSQKLKGE